MARTYASNTPLGTVHAKWPKVADGVVVFKVDPDVYESFTEGDEYMLMKTTAVGCPRCRGRVDEEFRCQLCGLMLALS